MSKPLLLLVDDSTEMGVIVSCLGKRAGWEVLVCLDAETAWIALSQRLPDLVLLDVNLPGVSGPEWLRRVRAAPNFAGLSVALYIHRGLANDVAAGLDAGADFLFDKDLVASPADWQRRLAEIQMLASNMGRTKNVSDAWPTANAPPRIDRGEGDSRLSAVRSAAPDVVRISGGFMKAAHAILLVEDNPADVKITQRALRESAVPVDLIVVRDGQEAVEYLLRQGPHADNADWRIPDLILLDLNLPRLTGIQVLERIRATPALRSTPVVVLTTSRRQEDVQQVYAAGANTYIEKPQDFNRFVQVLQTIQRYWLETALLPSSP